MNLFTKWKEKATQYVDVHVQLVKLGFIERSSHVLGMLISTLVLLFLGLAFCIFLGFSLMELFITLLDGNRVGGALLTTAFFGLLFAIVVMVRKSIVHAFTGVFIKIMTEPGDVEDDLDVPKVDAKVDKDDN